MKRLLTLGLCAALAACSSEPASEPPDVPQDAGADTGFPDAPSPDSTAADSVAADSLSSDAPAEDAPSDSSPSDAPVTEGGSSFESCEDTCAQTKLTLVFGGNTGTLDRAQFGFNANQTLHLEAHFGGDAACPTGASPTPDRTVVFGNVPIPTDSSPIQNTPVTLLDFKGTLSANPLDKATQATLTPVAAKTTPATGAFVAFEVEVTFPNGTMTGHLYATHCDSLDE